MLGTGTRLGSELMVVVGARPNFVKVAPVVAALKKAGAIRVRLVHTGQHYSRALSDAFLDQLSLPEPDFQLGVGSGSHAEQTAGVLVGVERILLEHPCGGLLVAGDVNSTLGAALAASKLGVPVIHLESGLRSRDWRMPEEVNRVLTDRLSDLLLCSCEEAIENLVAEGIDPGASALVGNTMIDSLFRLLPAARALGTHTRLGLEPGGYVLATLHRPYVVDDHARLHAVIKALAQLAAEVPVVFPVHPRTAARLGAHAVPDELRLLEPLDYIEFIALEAEARLVITDSGGVQEETSALGVRCLTYRDTTERPVTIELGTNTLVGLDPERLVSLGRDALAAGPPEGAALPLWDGQAGPRAARAIERFVPGAALGRSAAAA
jgi:UDP-N-acetylglucosamine 2-epimerase (non-hydrolysing)